MRINSKFILSIIVVLVVSACASKKNGKQNLVNRFYHNTTGYYNTYWNAQQLVDNAQDVLIEANEDDFSQILSVFPYDNTLKSGMVSGDMEKAIEKTAKVTYFHEGSRWLDDSYVLMGQAQILNNDYVSAEKTLSYFEQAFDVSNPDGRIYNKSIDRDEERSLRAQKRAEAREAKRLEAQAKKDAKRKEKEAAEAASKAANKKKKEKDRLDSIRKRSESIKKKERKKTSKKRKGRKKKSNKKKRRSKDVEFKTSNQQIVKTKEAKKIDSTPVVESKTKKFDKSIEESVVEDVSSDLTFTDEISVEKLGKTYNRGMYFLAEAKARKGDYSDARYILSKLSSQSKHDKFVRKQIPVLRSFIDLADNDYSSAKKNLEESIVMSSSKRLKSRYAFILGQLNSNENRHSKAYEYFSKSNKWAKDFNLEFNALLRKNYSAYLSGVESKSKVLKTLSKMSRMDKYEEQQAAVYSTIASIYVKEGDLVQAKKYLELGAKSKSSSPEMKKIAYYDLAMLYFDNKNYIDSKLYLDSTLTVINPEDPNFKKVNTLNDKLRPIADNLSIVILNDSLLQMTKLSDKELKELAKARVKEADRLEKKESGDVSAKNFVSPFDNKSTFPLYNQEQRRKGKQAFDKRWGRRPLVDNWRVKAILDADILQGDDEYLDKGDKIEAEIAKIKESIPYSEDAKEKLYATSSLAYYELGKAYKLYIDEYKLSNQSFESMIRLDSDTENRAEAYYYMYLNYLALNNSVQANKYLKLIKEKYPDSKYIKNLDKSTYKEKLEDPKTLYTQAYNAFKDGNYSKSERISKNAMSNYPNDVLSRKFELLNIRSKGASVSKDEYINLLKSFYRENKNSEEGIKAGALLTAITGEENDISDVPSTELNNAIKVDYTLKEDATHYILIATKGYSLKELGPMRNNLAEFNKKNFNDSKLKSSMTVLESGDVKNIILIIKDFDDMRTAGTYLKKLKSDRTIFKGLDNVETYSISKFNYRRMKKSKSLESYKEFYNLNYSL